MWVPDLMIGSLLAAANITTCLNCTHSYSAIAIQHVQQSLYTTIHTESISSSLHLWLLTPWTLEYTVGTHSLHSTITLWLSHYCTLYWLAPLHWLVFYARSITQSQIHSLVLLTTHLVYCRNYTAYYTDWYSTDCIQLGWLTYIVLRADPPKTPLARSVLLPHVHVIIFQASHWSAACYPATC
jgi:hypothetical protein